MKDQTLFTEYATTLLSIGAEVKRFNPANPAVTLDLIKIFDITSRQLIDNCSTLNSFANNTPLLIKLMVLREQLELAVHELEAAITTGLKQLQEKKPDSVVEELFSDGPPPKKPRLSNDHVQTYFLPLSQAYTESLNLKSSTLQNHLLTLKSKQLPIAKILRTWHD